MRRLNQLNSAVSNLPNLRLKQSKIRLGFDILQYLPNFSRADWLIFIINRSTDG